MPEILSYNQEIYRKLIHISSSIHAILLWFLGKDAFLPYILIAAFIFPILDLLKKYIYILQKLYFFCFGIVTRPREHQKLSGASWVFIGSAATVLLFNEKISIISLLVMSLSDSAAAIIGMKYGNTKLFNKSLEGSFAFFISASIIIFSLSPALFIVNLAAVFITVIIELFSTPIFNDNLFVPVSTGLVLTLGEFL